MDSILPAPVAATTRSIEGDQERAAYWRKRFEDWRVSKLTQAEYARLNGLTLSQFSYWKRKFDPFASSMPQNSLVAVNLIKGLQAYKIVFYDIDGISSLKPL